MTACTLVLFMSAMRFRIFAAVGFAFFVAGCFTTNGASANAIPAVRVQAEHDFDCAQSAIRITQEIAGRFEAIGCGHRATYLTACEGLQCTVEEQGKSIPWRARPDPSPTP